MEALTVIASRVAQMPDADIDTDIIFPARFLLITEKQGLGRYAFHDRRYQSGVERADFPLGAGTDGPARILIAGENFGCGSSREQAVWALHDLGVRVILAPGFGEIFQANCFRNGILAVTLPRPTLDALPGALHLTVDLTASVIRLPDGETIAFAVAPWRRDALLNGWDEVMTLLSTKSAAIAAFEQARRDAAPWLFPSP
jgi:3-isopropylmalate dehydratase small subunit